MTIVKQIASAHYNENAWKCFDITLFIDPRKAGNPNFYVKIYVLNMLSIHLTKIKTDKNL